ncbi:MAG: hypothetical protein RBT38_13530 [Bacteroidales bacterium]|jgi:hypothetical protein|nr:hypothetical protein [Bacteroidales bacterium]HOX76243.1 hypothetical protein [Bacteroidales bacterium]
MKTLKKLSAVFALGLVLALIPVSSNAKEDVEGVVITCSAGTTGKCYRLNFDVCDFYLLVAAECEWTGLQRNYCSLILVKAYNICVDYIM